jgi:hypothetical protein
MTVERLNLAIGELKAGNKPKAKQLLADIVRTEPQNETAWLYLAACITNDEQKKYCLLKVLSINPTNQAAQKALAQLEFLQGSTIEEITQKPKNVVSKPENISTVQNTSTTNVSRQGTPPATSTHQKLPTHIKRSRTTLWTITATVAIVIVLGSIAIFIMLTNYFKEHGNPAIAPIQIILPTLTPIQIILPTLTPTLTPEQIYSRNMRHTLELIDAFNNGPISDWDKLLTRNIPGGYASYSGLGNTTYGDFFRDVIRSLDYPILYQAYLESPNNQDILLKITDSSQQVIDASYEIQVSLGGIIVPMSMTVPHNEIENCIEAQYNYFSLIIRIMAGIMPSESDIVKLDENNCSRFEMSINLISDFISKNP